MKKFLLASAASALVLGAATVSQAADAVMFEETPAPIIAAPGFSWTGFYAGIHGGYGFGEYDSDTVRGAVLLPGFGVVPGVFEEDDDGLVGGVHAGYNYDLGGFIVGGEIDVTATDLEFVVLNADIDYLATARIRAGVDLGRTFVYGTGGLAYADISGGGVGEFDDDPVDSGDIGYVIGAGVDYAVTDNIIVGGDYLYHSFDDFDDTGLDVDVQTVRARLSFKF